MSDKPLPDNLTIQYLDARYRALLSEMRAIERLRKLARTPTEAQTRRMERRDRTSEEGRKGHE